MSKKFIQRHNKALAEIASKTISVLPFIDDNPEAKAERIRRTISEGWDAFSFFCHTYFPHIFPLPFCPAHETMFDETDKGSGIIAITGFRGLGKTVLMGVVYPIWMIIKGERYIIHTAADSDLAQERTAFTLHELQNNKRLTIDYPELQPMDSFDLDFYLKNKARIRARSIKQSHRGTINPKTAKRPGLIVCDDIDKEENMGNLSIGKRRMEKISQELAGALAPDGSGKIIWLGNLVHPNYAICQFQELILSEMRADNPDFDLGYQSVLKTHQKAILRFSLEDQHGKSTWEAQYPTATLPNLRAKFGMTGYQREMLGQPVIEGNIFKNHWFTKYRTLPEPSQMKRVWLYADPAWGEKGCYKAVISIGYDGNRFYVIHVWIRQTENTKFFRYYYDAYQELDRVYRVKARAACETTYGQARILADFDRWATDNNLPPLSHRIKRIDNKDNKNLRIERTETIIETAKVLFPEGQDTPTLISQFLTYPDGYIDGCDALAGCLERFSEYDIGRNRVKVRRLVIQMLSDMPRAEKLNQGSIDKLMGIINTQLGDDFAALVNEPTKAIIDRCVRLGLRDSQVQAPTKTSIGLWGIDDQHLSSTIQKQQLFWIGNHFEADVRQNFSDTLSKAIEQGYTKEMLADTLKDHFNDIANRSSSYW